MQRGFGGRYDSQVVKVQHSVYSEIKSKWTCTLNFYLMNHLQSIEWRSHALSGKAHGTYEIEQYEWVFEKVYLNPQTTYV